MDPESTPNTRSPSTTWAWKRVKIAQPPQAKSDRASEASSLRSLLPWPRQKPLTLSLKYRGGPEAWWEIRARGRIIRRPGVIALHDLMLEVMQWKGDVWYKDPTE